MNNQRLLAIQAVGALLLVVLAVQLVRLQLYAEVPAPSAAQDAARGNISGEYVRSVPVEPLRGQIMDRTGSILASNVATFSLALVPGNLPADPAQRLSALRAIERVGLVPRSVIEEALAQPLAEIDPLAPLTLESTATGRQGAVRRRRPGSPYIPAADAPKRQTAQCQYAARNLHMPSSRRRSQSQRSASLRSVSPEGPSLRCRSMV